MYTTHVNKLKMIKFKKNSRKKIEILSWENKSFCRRLEKFKSVPQKVEQKGR
jgi:hypothetical protein